MIDATPVGDAATQYIEMILGRRNSVPSTHPDAVRRNSDKWRGLYPHVAG